MAAKKHEKWASTNIPSKVRNLVVVFGDQLDPSSSVFDDFDPIQDCVWMAEVDHEATYVWSHKFRLVFFFSAMRHFRAVIEGRKFPIWYHELTETPDGDSGKTFSDLLTIAHQELLPERIVTLDPSDYRVQHELEQTAERLRIPIEYRDDSHFYCSKSRFRKWASSRKTMVLEHFYREMRREHSVLLTEDDKPEGGEWNFDAKNRGSFGKSGPPKRNLPVRFPPDKITKQVIKMVESRFADHPGQLDEFDLPVTSQDAELMLADFLEHRLHDFGTFQDAMWGGEDELFHSRISAPMNVRLVNPRQAVAQAEQLYREGKASLESVEGFIRQIIGWREYVRGIYWLKMPNYQDLNHFEHEQDVPSSFWDGKTEMACVADAMQLVQTKAYAHHIQRLMVLGLFAQMLGVHPYRFHEWHMAMYADAIEWVSLPNTLGMSQFGDGGILATKPYCASGAYIERMSNHCSQCRFNPKEAVGENACPFTTLYWDFLARNREEFSKNRRMVFQVKNLEKKSVEFFAQVQAKADAIRAGGGV